MESLQGLNQQNHRIYILLEDDNLNVWNLNWAVSIILDLLFAIWIGLTQISTVYTILTLLNFWIIQNPTLIIALSVLLNGDNAIAKKLLI